MFPPPKNRKKKRRKSRHTRLYILTGAGVAVLLAILLCVALLPRGSAPVVHTALPMSPGDAYACGEGAIFYVQDTSLYCCDFTGTNRWEVTLPETGMQVYTAGRTVVAYSTSTVCVYTSTGELVSTTAFYGTIQMVRCSDTLTAVLVEDSSNTPRIVILDRTGTEKKRDTFNDSYVVDFGFFGTSLYYYTVSTHSVQPTANIVTFSETLNNTGNVAIEGEILQGVLFGEDKIYAIGTNHVIQTDYLGKKNSEKLIYGWVLHDWLLTGSEEPSLLFVLGGESSDGKNVYAARISTQTGEDLYLQMPANTKQVALGSERIYAFTSEGIKIYNLTGKIVSEHAFSITAQEVALLPDDKHILLSDGQAMYLATLP